MSVDPGWLTSAHPLLDSVGSEMLSDTFPAIDIVDLAQWALHSPVGRLDNVTGLQHKSDATLITLRHQVDLTRFFEYGCLGPVWTHGVM